MTQIFEKVRARLWGVAYRMLGSVADAEDAIQDTFLNWQKTDRGIIDNPEAWLIKTCTHRCIDMLRAAKSSRIDYVGMWLPEPVLDEGQPGPDETVAMTSSLTTAFLLLLERLSPVERAAYLLRDIFDYSYQDIAIILGRTEVACRQIVSRAKKRLGQTQTEARQPDTHQLKLLGLFMDALKSGNTEQLEKMLTNDIALWADGGGKVVAAAEVIESAVSVAQFLSGTWQLVWHQYEFLPVGINGTMGLLMRYEGKTVGTISLSRNEQGKYSRIFIVRNPDKLSHIENNA